MNSRRLRALLATVVCAWPTATLASPPPDDDATAESDDAPPAEDVAEEDAPETEPEPEPEPEPAPAPEPEPEPADDGFEDARDRFSKGAEHYELGEYGAAIEIFEALYRETRETTLLYNLGQTYWRRFGVDPQPDYLRQARSMFENYDKAMREEVGYDPREVQGHIRSIDAQLAGIEAASQTDLRPRGPSPQMLEYDRKRRMYQGMTASGATLTALGGAAGITALVGAIVRGSAGFALDQSGGGEAGEPNPLSAEEDAQLRSTFLTSGQLTFGTAIAAGVLLPVGIALLGVGVSRSKRLTQEAGSFAVQPTAGGLRVAF